MKVQGIQLASEGSVRRLSGEMFSDNLAGTEVPLSQPLRLGVDLKASPLVYVPDLVGKIFQLLEQNARYIYMYITCIEQCLSQFNFSNSSKQLTWHDSLIPESEVWVKIAGDKGANTVKLVFQLCNVPSFRIPVYLLCLKEETKSPTSRPLLSPV